MAHHDLVVVALDGVFEDVSADPVGGTDAAQIDGTHDGSRAFHIGLLEDRFDHRLELSDVLVLELAEVDHVDGPLHRGRQVDGMREGSHAALGGVNRHEDVHTGNREPRPDNRSWFDALNRRRALAPLVIGIVVSHADEASTHIGEQLLDLVEWQAVSPGVYEREGFELREFETRHLELDRVAEAFGDIEYVVVASKHSGDTGPLLSAHFTGNFGPAEYGGADRELSVPTPNAHRAVIDALRTHAPEGFDVSAECTHHGPTDFGAPGMFVELGSGPEEWADEAGARAVAKAILDLEGVPATDARTLVALGGNHYAPRPTRIIHETEFAVGHIAADWSLDEMGHPTQNEDLVETMFETSGADCAIIDGDLPTVEDTIEDLGYRVVSETWVRETSGISPELVASVESSLGTVDEGVRFGDGTDRTDTEFEVVDLPMDLVDACLGIDSAATIAAVSGDSIAYRTTENGNRVGDRAAVPDRGSYRAIVDGLVGVLETSYDVVRQTDDTIEIERSAFDPERAAALGVPEGPKFGRLAAGEPVTVDGQEIDPDSVHTRETRRFEV